MAEIKPITIRWPKGVQQPNTPGGITLVEEADQADLLVLTSSEAGANQEGTPPETPLYVLLEDDNFQTIEHAWRNPGIIGCSRSNGDSLPPDLERIALARYERRKMECSLSPAVEPHPNPPSIESFVTLTLGRMRRFMAEVTDALQAFRGAQTAWKSRLPDPFLGRSSAEWLDVIHADYNPPSDPDKIKRIDDLRKKIYKKIHPDARERKPLNQENLVDIRRHFGCIFGWSEKDVLKVSGEQSPEGAEDSRPPWTIPTLLIEGETGTGKTLLARYLQACLPSAPFRFITCTNISEKLLEIELFGAMAESYTGIEETKVGQVLAAYGGVVFLDEIGDMPLELQVKLLSLLNEGLIHPVGWSGPALCIPVILIAATNKNLRSLIKHGKFREDLYFRLRRRMVIPPLRQRIGDLEKLVAILLARDEVNHDRKISGLSKDALAALKAYAFPGNFRELETVLHNAAQQARMAGGTMILSEDLCFEPGSMGTSSAAFVLPLRKNAEKREVVLAWNPKWETYHFIGGRQDPAQDREDFVNILLREIKEKTAIELQPHDVKALGGIMETTQHSGRADHAGERRWYRFQFFKIIDQTAEEKFFQLPNDPASAQESSALAHPVFVWASDWDIEKGFIHHRRISEAVQECWWRLDAEGFLK